MSAIPPLSGDKQASSQPTENDATDPKLTFTMASFRNIQFGTKKAFGTAEPLTPDAFGDPHFCQKQFCAGALCA